MLIILIPYKNLKSNSLSSVITLIRVFTVLGYLTLFAYISGTFLTIGGYIEALPDSFLIWAIAFLTGSAILAVIIDFIEMQREKAR